MRYDIHGVANHVPAKCVYYNVYKWLLNAFASNKIPTFENTSQWNLQINKQAKITSWEMHSFLMYDLNLAQNAATAWDSRQAVINGALIILQLRADLSTSIPRCPLTQSHDHKLSYPVDIWMGFKNNFLLCPVTYTRVNERSHTNCLCTQKSDIIIEDSEFSMSQLPESPGNITLSHSWSSFCV